MDAERSKSCSLFLENMDDYLDGELNEDMTKAIKAHLDECDDCRSVYDSSSLMLKELSLLDADTVIPLQCQASWRKAVRGEAKRVSGKKGIGRFIRAAGAIAAAGIVIFGVSRFIPSANTALPRDTASQYASEEYAEADYAVSNSAYSLYTSAKTVSGDMILQTDGELGDYAQQTAAAEDAEAATGVIIRNAKRKIETHGFDQCVKSIADLVEEYEGYYESNTVEGQPISPDSPKGRVANMTARVPSVDLDAFLTGLDAVGEVTYSRETAEDISENYYDTKSRLTSYKNQLARLNELVTTAADLEQLLMLEEKISDVQYSIDSYEGTIKLWDNQVGYSTVAITVTETAQRDKIVTPSQSMGERARTAFYDGLNWLNDVWQGLIVALAAAAPALIAIIPLIAIILVVITLIRKKRK